MSSRCANRERQRLERSEQERREDNMDVTYDVIVVRCTLRGLTDGAAPGAEGVPRAGRRP